MGGVEGQLSRPPENWTPYRVERFARAMANALLDDFAHGASSEQLEGWIDVAIDRALGLATSTGSKIKDSELDRLAADVGDDLVWVRDSDRDDVAVYAIRIRAVRQSADRFIVTPIGRLVRELPDKDAIRWLLAAEVVQSDGRDDEWRLSREAIAFLLENPDWTGKKDPPPRGIGCFLWRLSNMGILTAIHRKDRAFDYFLLPAGRLLLEEVGSGKETPFTILVRAILQDETAAAIDHVRPAGAAAPHESSADATARHARMVAHEIRNALVPVQSAVESLYRDLDRQGAKDVAEEKRRATIEEGIGRVFRFLRDISRIADVASAPSDLFDMTPAIQDAIAAFSSNNGLTIPFDQEGALPAVKGHRDRFVLALLNVLRNAAQARPVDGLRIRVSAGTHNGAEVFVAVEDNGPGVPVEHRANIFEPGFSLRPDGTGQGLALVREVIEVEMAGRAMCEQGALGGARIVLRLPVGAKRKK